MRRWGGAGFEAGTAFFMFFGGGIFDTDFRAGALTQMSTIWRCFRRGKWGRQGFRHWTFGFGKID
jgi:hypothetical protein